MRATSGNRTGDVKDRILIISQPKAGTYLVASALEKLGYKPTNLHISPDHFEDYTGATKSEFTQGYKKFRHESPLEETLSKVTKGSFAVSHLTKDDRCIQATRAFTRFLLTRELRAAVVSMFHFEKKRHKLEGVEFESWMKHHGGAYIRRVSGIAEWRSDISSIKYEDLISVNKIASSVLAIETNMDQSTVEAALSFAVGGDTNTKAPSRPHWKTYWTPEIEKFFLLNNGDLINERLGYQENLSTFRRFGIWTKSMLRS